MSVRHLTDKKWIIDYYPTGAKGKRVRRVFEGTQPEAYKYEIEIRREGVSLPPAINPRIMDILPDYLEWVRIHQSPKTYEDKRNALKLIREHFGRLQVPRITPTIIDQYKALRHGRPRSIIKELNYLSSIIKWMVKNNYAHPLPFKIEKVPYRVSIPDIPHPSEIGAFIKQIKDTKKKAFVYLLYHAGLRMKDARNIRWENINWKMDTITLSETKGDVPRLSVLPVSVKRLLRPYRQTVGYVFENPHTGKPIQSLKTLFRGASERAKVKRLRPHLLRHASGTFLLDATGDLRLVQEHLGHKNIGSTQIYTHISAQRKKMAMGKLTDHIGQMEKSRKRLKQDHLQ